MATEFEIKLRAKSVEQLGEILRDAQVVKLAQEKLREIHMRTTYFDTADGALSERRWMLRVRQENAQRGLRARRVGMRRENAGGGHRDARSKGRAGRTRGTDKARARDGLRRGICAADAAASLAGRHDVRNLRRRGRAAWRAA